MCKSHILIFFLIFLIIYLLLLLFFFFNAGQVKFQRSGPEISNCKLTENGDAQGFDPNLPSLKGVLSTEMLFVVS